MDKGNAGPRQFIEDMGDLIDEHGLPHMAGRIIGALLVCSPPFMSLGELAEALQASKGAISMSTQLLLRLGIIARVSLPGHRRHYFQIQLGFWEGLFLDRSDHIERHLAVVRNGLEQMRGEPVDAKRRLIEMQAFCDFVLEELPRLSERWAEQHDALIQRRLAEHI